MIRVLFDVCAHFFTKSGFSRKIGIQYLIDNREKRSLASINGAPVPGIGRWDVGFFERIVFWFSHRRISRIL